MHSFTLSLQVTHYISTFLETLIRKLPSHHTIHTFVYTPLDYVYIYMHIHIWCGRMCGIIKAGNKHTTKNREVYYEGIW